MANELKLENQLSSDTKPVKVGDDSTGLLLKDNDVEVENTLTVNGDLEVKGDKITSDKNLTIDVNRVIALDSNDGIFKFYDSGDIDDYFSIDVQKSTGATTLASIDNSGTAANFTLDSGGGIILDAATGKFLALNAGSEFSAANSSYAGMILGYTAIGLDETPATYDVLASMDTVHNDLKVSFTFPPSGKVEIFVSIYVQTDGSRPLTFGLSTTDADATYTSLGAKYENHTIMPDETDGLQHTHRWYVTGTPGDAEELWFAAGCTQTNRFDLFWGGDSSSVADGTHPMEYQPFIMKATALPLNINDGS